MTDRKPHPVATMKAAIDSDFMRIARACEADSEADRLLLAALEYAVDAEKRHRRGAPYLPAPKHRLGVEHTARRDVVFRFLEAYSKPPVQRGPLHWATIRRDVFLCSALAELFQDRGNARLVERLGHEAWLVPPLDIDYSTDIAVDRE